MSKAGTRVYRINTPRLLVLPLVWLGFAGLLLFPLATGATAEESSGGILGAAILTVILWPIFYFTVWRSRLEVNDEGITHFQFGYTIHSSWQNLERLSMERGAEGLYLKQPGSNSVLLRESAKTLQTVAAMFGMKSAIGDADALAAGRFIALMTFTGRLHGGALSRDLAKWAPQLTGQ